MTMPTDTRRVSAAWRLAALGLSCLLVLSGAFLGYAVIDNAVSLDYCRMEQTHLRHSIKLLVTAATGRLSSSDFVAARAKHDPELPQRLDDNNTFGLAGATLQFRPDGLLAGMAMDDD